ncbi:MAG: hypothetical protein LQ349_002147 [Xanthoria aureola]|nr:MAG: hypothetical protein LQ349_002147 [Xanthoria aureola]
MAGTRSSARQAANAAASSSPASSQSQSTANKDGAAGAKRKGGPTTSPKAKRGRKGAKKEQATLEDTLPNQATEDESKDTEMKEQNEAPPNQTPEDESKDVAMKDESKAPSSESHDQTSAQENPNGTLKPEDPATANGKGSKQENLDTASGEPDQAAQAEAKQNGTEEAKPSTGGDAVEESSKREESTPSSILEKGIIYFFFRGRVGINEPSDVNDIARSYIILRPLPHGAKLGDGPIADAGHNRMLALPKKVLPASPKDRFMNFVEKTNVTMEEIKDSLSSSDYMTKTAGSRHTPAAAPIGEGVYAITSTGRETHLAYILTIPSEVNEVQEGVGLKQRGSFVTSAKNPETAAPGGASLPKGAEYPKEILDEFRGRGWMPLEPKLLDYENTQFLLIGHNDGALDKATVPQPEDAKQNKDEPKAEMEKLEHEDDVRVEHLKGDDSVFEDLGLSSKEYPKLQTTW